jgi:uncharacterized protein
MSKASEVEEIMRDIKEVVTGQQSDDDILELTEIVNEDGSTTEISNTPLEASMEAVSDQGNIDALFDNPTSKADLEQEKLEDNAIIQEAEIKEKQKEDLKIEHAIIEEAKIIEEIAVTISSESLEASVAPIRDLIKTVNKRNGDGLSFNSGITVEEIVIELLRPEITKWLDGNLPNIVKSVVEKEIRKIIPKDE